MVFPAAQRFGLFALGEVDVGWAQEEGVLQLPFCTIPPVNDQQRHIVERHVLFTIDW